jgi:hypothetical protein
MANQSARGGMKQGREKSGEKQHQGVRPGSTARAKERHQVEKRDKKSTSARTTK